MNPRDFLQVTRPLPEPMFLVSGEGVLMAANPAVADLLNLNSQALCGARLQDLVADPADKVARYLSLCSRSRQMLPGTLSWHTRDGQILGCHCEGAVLEPKSSNSSALILLRCRPKAEATSRFVALNQKIAALAREVTERKRTESILYAQREWLRVTLSSIGDAVIATDREGRVIFMNTIAESLTGWRQEEAAGQPLENVFKIINEETRRPAESPVIRVFREGIVVGLANHTVLLSRDGSERPIDDSAAPIRDGEGNLLGVVLVFHDITERRQLEKELQRRMKELVEADRRKNEFLAMLGHELRNPLAAITNALHLRQSLQPNDLAFKRVGDILDRQIALIGRLVDDLLDVGRITRGKIELRKEIIDIATVVARAVEAVRSLINTRHQVLEVSLPSEPIHLEADPTRLEQVLVNLLNNAAKYTNPGGHIRLLVEREGHEVVLKVRDTGVGIPPELLPYVFDLFTQGNRSLDRVQGGLGIGLTLVRSLVERHGGSVKAHSKGPGRGSEFTVRLPALVEGPPEGPQVIPEVAEPVGQNMRVLIVDDNVDAAMTLGELLRLWGYEVRTVYDGLAAIESVLTYQPKVVLLDIGLPGLDGYEVARRLRQEFDPSRLVLIALTGYGQQEDRSRSQEAGFNYHFTKPVDFATLQKVLSSQHPK